MEVQLPHSSGNGLERAPIEGAGVPHREGAQEASPNGEQLRQHQASTGGDGVIPLRAPGMPTAAERARHEVDHCQCRAWCRSCVADGHYRRESEEDGVPYVAADCAFMGEEGGDCRMTSALSILVYKFHKPRWVDESRR